MLKTKQRRSTFSRHICLACSQNQKATPSKSMPDGSLETKFDRVSIFTIEARKGANPFTSPIWTIYPLGSMHSLSKRVMLVLVVNWRGKIKQVSSQILKNRVSELITQVIQ